VLLVFINPVQFPLHEPYFDLTPIKVTHTKITQSNISPYYTLSPQLLSLLGFLYWGHPNCF